MGRTKLPFAPDVGICCACGGGGQKTGRTDPPSARGAEHLRHMRRGGAADGQNRPPPHAALSQLVFVGQTLFSTPGSILSKSLIPGPPRSAMSDQKRTHSVPASQAGRLKADPSAAINAPSQ